MSSKKVYRLKEVEKPYTCKKCGKKFKEERYLKQHNKRKTACNNKFVCKKCGKECANTHTLRSHLNRKTPCVPEEIPIINNSNEENKCQYCGKTYSNKHNLTRHQKTCDKDLHLQFMMKKLLEENGKKWAKRIKELTEGRPMSVNNTINNNVINVQQNTYLNVTICSFGDEDLTKLDKNKVMELLKGQMEDFMPRMIEHIHANPEHPEFHNVFYDPEREKAIIFAPISKTEMSWQMGDIKEVSGKIINKIKNHIRPGSGPYFDIAMKERDAETSNNIIKIANHIDWMTNKSLEQSKKSLTKITKNEEFMKLVEIAE